MAGGGRVCRPAACGPEGTLLVWYSGRWSEAGCVHAIVARWGKAAKHQRSQGTIGALGPAHPTPRTQAGTAPVLSVSVVRQASDGMSPTVSGVRQPGNGRYLKYERGYTGVHRHVPDRQPDAPRVQRHAPVVSSVLHSPAKACPGPTTRRGSRAAGCSGVAIGLAQACIVMSRSNSGARRPCNGMLRRCHRGCTVLQRHVPDRQRSAASPHYAPRTFRARGATPRPSADARTPTDRARSSISRSSMVRRSFCSMLMER